MSLKYNNFFNMKYFNNYILCKLILSSDNKNNPLANS